MKVSISGLALWGRGLTSYQDLVQATQAGALPADAEFVTPKPEEIPARERRRAGLMINLATALAHQACEHAGVDKSLVPSVFVSCMGDTDITDYMCRKLTQPEKLLSPTKFHNSVHNAASGYWTISAENHAPSTFVGGFDHSVGAGMLEAISQVHAANQAVLLVAYDIANRPPFSALCPVEESFGAALVFTPEHWPAADAQLSLQLDVELDGLPVPRSGASADSNHGNVASADLERLMKANPSASCLPLMEQLVRVQEGLAARAEVRVRAAPQLDLIVNISQTSR